MKNIKEMKNIKKTILIWTDTDRVGVKYAIMEGDLSRFQNIMINLGSSEFELEKELCGVMYDEDGMEKVDFIVGFPTHLFRGAFADNGDCEVAVVSCGFVA